MPRVDRPATCSGLEVSGRLDGQDAAEPAERSVQRGGQQRRAKLDQIGSRRHDGTAGTGNSMIGSLGKPDDHQARACAI